MHQDSEQTSSITKLTVEEDTVAYRQRDEANVSRRHSRDFGSRRDRKTENNPGKPLDSLSYSACTTNV